MSTAASDPVHNDEGSTDMPEPTDTPWIDPATCNLVRVIRARGGDDYVAHIHAAALAPLRSRWADEVQAVKKAGAARNACRQSLDRTRQRVADLREARARLSSLRESAKAAADEAARLHAEALVKHGGKQTAEGRAADAAAKRAAEALAEAEVDLGRDIDAATYGDALVAEAEAEIAKAEEVLSDAAWIYFDKRATIIKEQIEAIAGSQIAPLLDALDATLRASRHLTKAFPARDRELRLLVRDGVRVEPMGVSLKAMDELIATFRKVAGVEETWRGRVPEADDPPAVLSTVPLPPRPVDGRQTTI